MNAPYRFDEFDGWVVVEEGSETPLLTTSSAHRARARFRPRPPPGAALSSERGPVRGLRPPRARRGRAEERPHRHRHGQHVRLPDALRPLRGLPARDDEEGALQVPRGRAPLVPARRLERPLAAGARRDDLGRVGRRGRRARAGLRRPVAQLADTRRRPRRPDRRGRAASPRGSRLATDRRERLERRGHPADGARAMPRLLPVPRRGRRAALAARSTSAAPTSSSASRSTSRATRCSRTCSRSSATSSSATSSGRAATATSTTTTASRSRRCSRATRSRIPTLRLLRRPPSIFDYAFEDFEVVGLRAPSGDPRAGRRVTVALVAAVARGGVIGRDGAIPWHLPEDVAHFKELTTGHAVVMGRRTWDSLPDRFRPLPGRRNVVVTRNPEWRARGRRARRLGRGGARAPRAT